MRRCRNSTGPGLVGFAMLALHERAIRHRGHLDVVDRARQLAGVDAKVVCPRPQPVVRDIRIEEYYTDAGGSRPSLLR